MEKQQKKSNKKRIWDIIVYSFAGLLILLGAGLLISENVVFSDYSPPPTMPAQTPHITPDTSETALPSTAPEPTVTPEPTPAAAPMYIYFPRFEIQSLVKPVGLADDGSIGTIDAADIAAWYQDSPIPGEYGNSQINGHVRYGGKKGSFSVLADFKENDEVIIELADGSFRYFYVESVAVYSYADFPKELLTLDGEARMTLITCSGEWSTQYGTSKDRIVVICKPKV